MKIREEAKNIWRHEGDIVIMTIVIIVESVHKSCRAIGEVAGLIWPGRQRSGRAAADSSWQTAAVYKPVAHSWWRVVHMEIHFRVDERK